jgi:hypothetical protein
MVQARKIDIRMDSQDFERIKTNAKAAGVTASEFLRNLGVKFTPEVNRRFKQMYGDMMGEYDESYHDPIQTVTVREGYIQVIEKIDALLKTLDEEGLRMRILFEKLGSEKRGG